jgi:hypothetical protein
MLSGMLEYNLGVSVAKTGTLKPKNNHFYYSFLPIAPAVLMHSLPCV